MNDLVEGCKITGDIRLDGEDIPFMPEHDRSRRISRLFQDPLRGTAPHMTIEENLALAYLRASHGNPFSRINRKEQAMFREQLALLDMGLEDRMNQPVGLLSGGHRRDVSESPRGKGAHACAEPRASLRFAGGGSVSCKGMKRTPARFVYF